MRHDKFTSKFQMAIADAQSLALAVTINLLNLAFNAGVTRSKWWFSSPAVHDAKCRYPTI